VCASLQGRRSISSKRGAAAHRLHALPVLLMTAEQVDAWLMGSSVKVQLDLW
jgi:hypothetical protein